MFRFQIHQILYGLIWLYQKVISFDHGPLRHITGMARCKFYPTCSEYARGALEKHGIIKGMALTVHRLLRCNPFSNGGVDQP